MQANSIDTEKLQRLINTHEEHYRASSGLSKSIENSRLVKIRFQDELKQLHNDATSGRATDVKSLPPHVQQNIKRAEIDFQLAEQSLASILAKRQAVATKASSVKALLINIYIELAKNGIHLNMLGEYK